MDFTDIVKGACSLSKHVKHIYSCPDRKNIRLSLVDAETKSISCLNWLLNLIVTKKEECPKVLIYCHSQALVSWLFGQFKAKLGLKLFKNEINAHDNFLVGMYHADTSPFNKEKYLKALTSDEMLLPRVLIATSAIGCGINAKKLQYVCHFGPAFSLVGYCQQVGRAGRNGEANCHGILYKYKGCFNKETNIKMKNYCSLDTCLRTGLFTPFSENREAVLPIVPAHSCCSVCSKTCKCGDSHDFVFERKCDFELIQTPVAIRSSNDDDKSAIKVRLFDCHLNYFKSGADLNLPSSSITGLTPSLIANIVENLDFIGSIEYLMNNFSIVDYGVAEKIYQIIMEYFDAEVTSSVIENVEKDDEKYVFSDFENLSDFDVDFELEND